LGSEEVEERKNEEEKIERITGRGQEKREK